MSDLGLTHVALPVTQMDASVAFYATYAGMEIVHERTDATHGTRVVWVSDRTRPFVIVLIEVPEVRAPLLPIGHLGVGCSSRDEVDRLCAQARDEDRPCHGPIDSGYPVGYWALISDPDDHTLEIAHGQEVALTVKTSGETGSPG